MQIEHQYDASHYKDQFTRNGGLFSLKVVEEKSLIQSGSLEWIVAHRRFIETLMNELEGDFGPSFPEYMKCSMNFNQLLINLESGLMLSDQEILNNLLLTINNATLVNIENSGYLDKIAQVLKLVSSKYSL